MAPNFNTAFLPISKPTLGRNNYQGFKNCTEILPKGWNGYNQRPIESDILVEHDSLVTVRDGAKLYVDIYRPVNEEKRVPAILSWSPFGKKYNGLTMLQMTPWKCGVLPEDISGLEKFEGVDPGRWVARGYAVINVDARGAGHSDGSVPIMGTQEAEDGYDVIEDIAKRPWCNGNIGLAGNSHLAIVQWFIAALQPPSLKAIAPWEGCGDLYREQFVRGGVFNLSNFGLIQKFIIQGNEGVEDFQEMHRRSNGLIDAYWKDKRPNMRNIKVPAYITGSDFGSIHSVGSIRGYLEVDTPNKWIRWCGFQEWHDLWAIPETNVELMEFFDRYLYEKDNGWEKTPRVRWSALQFGDKEAIQDILLEDFPVPATEYKELFFASDNKLSSSKADSEATLSYSATVATDDSPATFTYTFPEKTRLIGLPKAHIFMSCADHNDFAICIELRKLDKDGNKLKHCTIPFSRAPVKSLKELPADFNSGLIVFNGPSGLLRASHRAIDREQSIHPNYPFHPHDKLDLVEPGTVVELEVGIWPMGIDYEAGESLQLVVSGTNPTWPELQQSDVGASEQQVNVGTHNIHFGGKYASRVILPFVPL